MKRVLILQEYVPGYRVPFFQKLVQRTAERGIQVTIAAGSPSRAQRRRSDEESFPGLQRLPQREFRIATKRVVLRRSGQHVAHSDLVIVEQARRNLDAYLLLSRHRPRHPKVALWGHGKDYVITPSRFDSRVQHWLARRADWFFAYTEGGARALESEGVPSGRVTVVQNSIDTRSLAANIRMVSAAEVESFSKQHDLRGRTASFIGGLDASKRLHFLVSAGQIAHFHDERFRLVVAGDGELRSYVQGLQAEYNWFKYIGPVANVQKAVLLRATQVLAMPGRVGLVTVDSFAAQVPIMTTEWQWHAPEYEYLKDRYNGMIVPDDAEEYGRALAGVMAEPSALENLRGGLQESSQKYTIERMVENFVGGIEKCLET